MKPGESNQPAPDLAELCHSLMERSPLPVAEMEGAGHILRYVNPAFCRLVGTFTVTLPLMAPHVEAGDSYPRHPADLGEVLLDSAPALDGLRVLVVDDEADAREIFRLMLTQCGAEVRMSASAAEALESLEQWRPDVLVSDIGMAGEDGYELMRKVRAMEPERGGQTPAVALTGYANVEDHKRALAVGFQMHIPKPVALIELATAVAVLGERAGTY